MSASTADLGATGGEGLFPESRPDIPTDDWDDQDLLTKGEARLRLEHSATLVRTELEQARSANPAAVAELEEQAARIERALANIR